MRDSFQIVIGAGAGAAIAKGVGVSGMDAMDEGRVEDLDLAGAEEDGRDGRDPAGAGEAGGAGPNANANSGCVVQVGNTECTSRRGAPRLPAARRVLSLLFLFFPTGPTARNERTSERDRPSAN